jgi:hypothetical protein
VKFDSLLLFYIRVLPESPISSLEIDT